MSATLDGNRLKAITVSGSSLGNGLERACVAASLSLSNSQVTEMQLTFLDTLDLDLFKSKVFHRGASIRYGQWQLTSHGLNLSSGSAGPLLKVTAPSRFVVALKKQTGAKTWGNTSVTAWVQSVAASVGMRSVVQPGLGNKTIARKKPDPGEQPESTWDVLTQIAREVGVWLYETGTSLVFAKPSWLVRQGGLRKSWRLVWNDYFSYSSGMTGMPEYTDDPDNDAPESLTVKLISADADTAKVGDAVVLSGRNVGPMGGNWIVNAVDVPMKSAAPVVLTCQRPIDPTPETPKTTPKAETTNSPILDGRNPYLTGTVAKGASGSVDVWVGNVNGRAIDMDGAYGAQCVDLANHYHIYCVGGASQVIANGNGWFDAAPASLYTRIGASSGAAKGDIACWNAFYGGGYGHVAIVLQDLGSNLKVMTQNPGGAHVDTLSKQGIQGYLRPKKFTSTTGNTSRGPVKVV